MPENNEVIIRLNGIQTGCIIGVYPEERKTVRPIIMDVALTLERPSDAPDSLDTTLNYEAIETVAIMVAQKGKFQLVESLAEALAAACLRFTKVRQVHIRVEKPGILPVTNTVCVEVTRTRP